MRTTPDWLKVVYAFAATLAFIALVALLVL
jgi:hypothetical protein